MTIDEYLWSGSLIGYVAALLVLVLGTLFGMLVGRAVEGPRGRD
jgi:hypothetical protein